MRAVCSMILALTLVAGCRTDASRALPLGSDAESCGSCHEDHYAQWSQSPHGTSASSPILEAMLPRVEEAWGLAAHDRCVGCHQPRHSEHDESIGCVSCHAAVGNHAESDGELAIALDRPLAGPFEHPEPTVAHASRTSSFLGAPELCGTCHELTGPRLAVEPTLTEYRASRFAEIDRTCADCHMPDDAERALSNDSSTVRQTSSHRFVGFDPPWDASADEAALAAVRTRQLLDDALDLDVTPTEDGYAIVVSNVGAGHTVPTGASALRDLWVDVEVDGALAHGRVVELGDIPMREETAVALLVDADRVEPNGIAAGESVRATIVEPADAVTVRLLGRAIRGDVLDALALGELRAQVPTHLIAEVRVTR